MRRLAVILGISMLGLAPPAEALTVRDIIELSRAGLGDEVLLALIDVDRGVYAIDTQTLKSLKEAGVSDQVIAALIRSGRERQEYNPEPIASETASLQAPQTQVIVIDHHQERAREFVAVPVYIPLTTFRHKFRRSSTATTPVHSTFVPFQSVPPLGPPLTSQPREPVFWGFGGQLRPDAWDPRPGKTQHPHKRD